MRNVIVTGGSRGLGLAISSALAAAGYEVIAISRSKSPELASAMAASGQGTQGRIHFRPFDLAQTSQLGEFVKSLRQEFGPLYGLINNAGIGTARVLTLMQDEQIEALVRLNTLSPIILAKHVVRSMMLERAGRIVNMASIVASTGFSGLAAYGATKASLVGFTRSLAREVGQLGITVNALAPGFIATEMTSELEDGQREQIARRSALRRMAEAGDVAAAAVFLLSDAGKNITGTTITIDAGNTA